MRHILKKIGLVLVVCTCVGMASPFRLTMRERVLPDLASHLDAAEQYIGEGKWQKALVQADSVLLDTPIRIFIQTDTPEQYKDSLASIDRAMDMWQQHIQSERLFVLVSSPEDADVTIRFVDTIQEGKTFCGGHIEWVRKFSYSSLKGYSYSYKATIDLAQKGSRNRALNLKQMTHAAAHELGHVLGLQDSSKRGDIMAPLDLRRPASEPRKEEIQTLLEVRCAAQEIRQQASVMAL